MTNNVANNSAFRCELSPNSANNCQLPAQFVAEGFPYSGAEFPVSGCGKLDATGCLPYPQPLIIRVIS
jgi:hypothetical protein